ncbi:MAG: alcohol dehydrogenase catalytic domain-containing protein [Armatimonadetes bacterium]|nr:alcohol dehydrogenase catalytic domain-containing protein [Armatimonadota bacterium]MDE2207653.1 alcohol dehydrogenase catalytic domain-containing protein [Armatimonadota bacterium]
MLHHDHVERAAAETMRAAVYIGCGRVELQHIAAPVPGDDELTVSVKACGLCLTDVKKITSNAFPAPRVFGHEIAGVVHSVGRDVQGWQPGDRVVVHHHVPCRDCFWCQRRLFASCEQFKRTGTTAGIGEPSGGGFSEMILVHRWCIPGLVRIPESVEDGQATFVEPVNTCLKALQTAQLDVGETLLVVGQGPIGLLFTWLAASRGIQVIAVDPRTERLDVSRGLGARVALEQSDNGLRKALSDVTSGRGADTAIVTADSEAAVATAVENTRAGGKIILFAHTDAAGRQAVSLGHLCREEQWITGSYSTDFTMQEAAAKIVFSNQFPASTLITHRMSLEELETAITLANRGRGDALKIVIEPERGKPNVGNGGERP